VSQQAPIRVAVIGCGQIGTAGHLPAFAAAARDGACVIVGVCDLDAGRAQRAARAFGTTPYTSAEALLATARPEVVSLATLPSSHLALTLQALDAGCHVLCEKPVAMDVAQAAAMVEAAERAGRLLSICFEYRYWDEAAYVRQRIATGELGHVYAVRTWGGEARGLPSDPLRRRRSVSGGGVLTHWTIHNLDLALWLLDEPEPLTASAFCYLRALGAPYATPEHRGAAPEAQETPEALDAVEDFGIGLVRLAGGTVVTVEANWFQPPSSRPEGWEILGEQGAASISPMRLWTDRTGAWRDETPPAGSLAPCDYDMTRLMTGFLQRVRDGGPSPVSGPAIVRIQRLMDALYESAARGTEVTLNPHITGATPATGSSARGHTAAG
jgi:predicted dehydrogenase